MLRRSSVLAAAVAAAAALLLVPLQRPAFALAEESGPVALTLDGLPAQLGNFSVHSSTTLGLSNGLLRVTLAAKGSGVNMQEWVVEGVNLAHTTEASWYCDWSGGKNGAHQNVDKRPSSHPGR